MWAFRTMIVPTELAGLARALAAGLSPAGSGMFETALSVTGNAPATHYISSGLIDPQFSDAIATPAALYAACQAVGASVTLAQCEALVSQSDVSSDAPFDAMARLGLAIVQSGEA